MGALLSTVIAVTGFNTISFCCIVVYFVKALVYASVSAFVSVVWLPQASKK